MPSDWISNLMGEDEGDWISKMPAQGTEGSDWIDSLLPPKSPEPLDVEAFDFDKLQSGLHRESVGEVVEEMDTSLTSIGLGAALGKSVEEYDVMKANPILTDKFKGEITETLSGYLELAKNPMEIIRGGAEFVMSLPGFGLGILGAGQKMLERMGGPFNLEDLYDAASEGMSKTMEMWHEGMVEPLLGPSSPEGQLVGSTAMAPALAIMAVGQAVADSESFKDCPNVRGLSRFAGDIGGLVALGRIYKGSKAKVTAKAEEVVRRAEQVVKHEEMLKRTPDEAIKAAQQKILDMEKIQLELEATEVQKNLDYGKMIKEDLSSKTKQIRQAKQADKYIADEAIDKVLREKDRSKIEPTTDLDLQTGTPEPPALSTHKSPFRETPKQTEFRKGVYETRKSVARNIDELITQDPTAPLRDIGVTQQKLTNDVNRWLNGEEIDVASSRNFLSELAARADELRMHFEDPADFASWKAGVSEAAVWARKAERTEVPTVDLNMMIPVDQLPAAVKDIVSKTKAMVNLRFKKLYRNEEVFDKTGFWLGKDDKWRFEIDDNKAKYHVPQAVRTLTIGGKTARRPLPEVLEGKDLGQKLYSGIPLDKAAKEIVAGARKVADYTRRAKGLKKFKPTAVTKILREGINRTVIDRSGNIRRDMLKALGEDGYKVIQKMYLAKGSSSRAAMMLDQMRKEIYRGLNANEKRVLDNLILAGRMADIGKYKTVKQFKFPEEISPKNSVAYSELFQYIEKLSPEQAVDLRSKVKSYFEWMKKPLSDMFDAGLISKEEFDALSSHNYRRIKLVEIYDKKYVAKVGAKKRTVYDSGVEALARGRDTDVFEPSSEIMALEVFNRAYGRIMNNEANKGLLEVARKDPGNPFVRVKENKGDKIPSGWNRIFMYEEGKRKALYLSPEMSKEWITSSPEVSYRFSQFLRYASGSPVLRTFATGIEWSFAAANLARDVMHTWFTARTFENGKWKSVYNPNLSVFGLQIGRDLATVFSDAAMKKGRYQDYINEGGGMEFLVHQGRLFQRGRHIEGPLDTAYDFLGYFGETTEIMTRLAIRERLIRKGKTPQEATFAARDYMDFGQGGGIAKALDNAFPYLNAAIQGTRGLVRSFQPGSGSALSSTYKLSQLAALTTGVYIAMSKMHPKSFDNLKGNIDMQNNLCLPLGDDFGFEDEHGQIRYPYIKIPLDPGQKFFKTFFEACADKWLGNEIDVNRVVDSLKELSPVGVGELPPTLSGAIGYMANKDFWLNEDIWKKTEPFSYPESKEEYIPGRIPQAMIDAGQLTGLSPERLKYAIEELVTGGSMWSYLLGQGYEELLGDLPESQKQQHLAMALARIPVIKRFFGVTNPYSKYAGTIEKKEEEVTIRRFTENRGFDVLVEGYIYEKNVERKEVIDYARKFKDKDTYDRLIDRFKFEEAIKKLPEKAFWRRMKGLTTEARAKVFVDRLEKSNLEEKEQLWKEYAIVARAKGIISKSFREEVNKIRTYGSTPKVRVD